MLIEVVEPVKPSQTSVVPHAMVGDVGMTGVCQPSAADMAKVSHMAAAVTQVATAEVMHPADMAQAGAAEMRSTDMATEVTTEVATTEMAAPTVSATVATATVPAATACKRIARET